MDRIQTIEKGRAVLASESKGIEEVAEQLGDSFFGAVELIYDACCASGARGRLIIMGMGKSGLVGQKIASTLTSTGTPSLFVHPAEALHGDLGVIREGDVVLGISNSGESSELVSVLSCLKTIKVPFILMTGGMNSTLAQHADLVLNAHVSEEACLLGLAPTTSTTATLALGDALAVLLMEKSGFQRGDYAALHPGGKLGKTLRKVSDLMVTRDRIPVVTEDAPMGDVLLEISTKKLGVTAVLSQDGKLVGVITDGDLRRWMERKGDMHADVARDVMTADPKTVAPEVYADDTLQLMHSHVITSLAVVSPAPKDELVGVIHMHHLVS